MPALRQHGFQFGRRCRLDQTLEQRGQRKPGRRKDPLPLPERPRRRVLAAQCIGELDIRHARRDIAPVQLADAPEGDADCDVCGASGNEDAMILCDGCDRGCVYDNATRERARENYLDRSDARSGRESARAAREGAVKNRRLLQEVMDLKERLVSEQLNTLEVTYGVLPSR